MKIDCPKCNIELKVRDFRRYGWYLVAFIIVLFPIKLYFFNIVNIFTDILIIIGGIYLITKKERYFAVCNICSERHNVTDKIIPPNHQ